MKIYHAQVNHLENPMGFRMERTVFSWKVKDAEGKKQSYARIRVASDAAMEHLLFDSGEDDKASSLFYPVKLDLEPRTRYYWNVEAGSDAGETAVSEVQFFETGKRNEAWTGKWISCDSKENRHPYFEKEIVPVKEVAKARLYVCGLGLYEVYVDERNTAQEEDVTDAEYLEILKSSGAEHLVQPKTALESAIAAFSTQYQYNKDYFVGDYVTMEQKRFGLIQPRIQLIGMVESFDQNGRSLTPTFKETE